MAPPAPAGPSPAPPAGPGYRGHVDEPAPGAEVPSGPVTVRGWSAWGAGPAEAVTVLVDSVAAGSAPVGTVRRIDVAATEAAPELADSGWEVTVDLAGRTEATLHVLVWGDAAAPPVVHDPIALRVGTAAPADPAPVDPVMAGWIDRPSGDDPVGPGRVAVAGGVLHPDRPVHRVDLVVNGRHAGRATVHQAPVGAGGIATFEHVVDLAAVAEGAPLVKIQVVAQTADGPPTAVASHTAGVSPGGPPTGRPDPLGGPMAESLEARVAALAAVAEGHAATLAELQAEATNLAAAVAARPVDPGVAPEAGARPAHAPIPPAPTGPDPAGTLVAQADIPVVMAWIADAAVVPGDLKVSVAMATRDRPQLLRLAVDSVLGQSHPNLELIVVDDSDGEETGRLLAAVTDPRVRVLRSGARKGAGAAYNLGLEAATGDVVTFLDDDNVMHRHWVRSLAWAFHAFPDVGALYGARIKEDAETRHGDRTARLPFLEFAPYDRDLHERANYIDRNALALRRAHADVRYDESLPAAIDWDHMLRLFGTTPPLALPVVACYYRTTTTGRISDLPEQGQAVRQVRSRAHRSRPLRVHVHSAMYPMITETYIKEDIDVLEGAGAVVTVSAVEHPVSPAAGVPLVTTDGEAAIAEARPDLVLLHWSTHAEGQLALLERVQVPFVCRVHSFDFDPERVARLLVHPLCAGVLAHPHLVPLLPPGVEGLLPVVGPEVRIPPSPARRRGVVSVSAGLPKKDFPVLIEAMARLPELERTIIVGRTNGVDELPGEVVAAAAARDPGIAVRVNVPREEVLEVLARSSTLLYTLSDELPAFGFPMSIVEAMLCGTVVVTPDRPEVAEVVGEEYLRTYRTVDDLVGHVREVEAGGPGVEATREGLRRRAQRHRDPAELRRLHDLLSDLLAEWKLRQA